MADVAVQGLVWCFTFHKLNRVNLYIFFSINFKPDFPLIQTGGRSDQQISDYVESFLHHS